MSSYTIYDFKTFHYYKRMDLTHDDLTTLPFTSTGYVRRDLRKSMGSFNKRWLMDMQPNEHIFTMLREDFRGGNTHANRYYVGQVLENVHSIDRSQKAAAGFTGRRLTISVLKGLL